MKRYFDEETIKMLESKENCYYKTVEKEHGGIAGREYYITSGTGWFHEKKEVENLNSFVLLHKKFKGMDGSWISLLNMTKTQAWQRQGQKTCR